MDAGPFLVGIAFAAAFVTGFLRNAVGGGIGLALTPILTIVLPPQPVLAMIGLLLLLSDPISLWFYWGRWDRGEARRLVPAMLVGIALGGWPVAGADVATPRHRRGRTDLRVGAARGHAARRDAVRGAGRPAGGSAGVVATGTLAYAMSDVVKVGTYATIGWITPRLLLATVAATPFLYLGSWLGPWWPSPSPARSVSC